MWNLRFQPCPPSSYRRRGKNIGLPGYNGTTGIMWEHRFYNFTDSIRVKSTHIYRSILHFVRDCITCHVLRGTRFKRWIGKRNPAFQVSLRRSWIESKRSFLVAQKEDSRSGSPNFLFRVEERRERGEREREKRNTKGTTLPRARIALSRTSWIARKETVLSRRKVLFVCASPLNQLFLQKIYQFPISRKRINRNRLTNRPRLNQIPSNIPRIGKFFFR